MTISPRGSDMTLNIKIRSRQGPMLLYGVLNHYTEPMSLSLTQCIS